MKTVWAPWRIEYILGNKSEGCVFCNALSKNDDLTLFKGNLTMVVMNKFPYINGHLLVAPVRHISALDELEKKEKADLLELVDKSIGILKLVMKPDGFNVGLNLGKVAGAGIEEHLHFHIVPRWIGDINALTVFADIRVIPEHIKSTYNNLKPYFEKLMDL
ncbi:MAG: HIT domain-containing protein [Desulfobacterium sp.]|nr:HIT domain-containing protein [Desulfobacterium sp.]MBU3947212.1 HIT domain-containing protein [Pseudomonadota bacterium]MBU4036430.1 HIT domain-containing protein [Pseudomonadota bacterium]